jgi:hypothetical protein
VQNLFSNKETQSKVLNMFLARAKNKNLKNKTTQNKIKLLLPGLLRNIELTKNQREQVNRINRETAPPVNAGTQTEKNFTNIDKFLNSLNNQQITNNIRRQLTNLRNTPGLNKTRMNRINRILNSTTAPPANSTPGNQAVNVGTQTTNFVDINPTTVGTNQNMAFQPNVNNLLTRYDNINVSKLKNTNKVAITRKLRTVLNTLPTNNNRRNRINIILKRLNSKSIGVQANLNENTSASAIAANQAYPPETIEALQPRSNNLLGRTSTLQHYLNYYNNNKYIQNSNIATKNNIKKTLNQLSSGLNLSQNLIKRINILKYKLNFESEATKKRRTNLLNLLSNNSNIKYNYYDTPNKKQAIIKRIDNLSNQLKLNKSTINRIKAKKNAILATKNKNMKLS